MMISNYYLSFETNAPTSFGVLNHTLQMIPKCHTSFEVAHFSCRFVISVMDQDLIFYKQYQNRKFQEELTNFNGHKTY